MAFWNQGWLGMVTTPRLEGKEEWGAVTQTRDTWTCGKDLQQELHPLGTEPGNIYTKFSLLVFSKFLSEVPIV